MPTLLLRLLLIAGLVTPLCASALGVGSLTVRSALNQTFEADIPLITNNPAELIGLTVRVPRQADFDQVGVEWLEFLSKLRFSVQTTPAGPSLIKITSIQPIREPSFHLLMEVVWSRGRLLRSFPVQLDPELYTNRRAPPPLPVLSIQAPVIKAPSSAAPAPAAPVLPPAPPVSFEGASLYGPVKRGENLSQIASRIRSSTALSTPQMMSILVAGNPNAFVNGNPSTLKAGTVLKVPTAQALGGQAPPSAPATNVAALAPVEPGATPPELPPPPPAAEPVTPPAAAARPMVTEPVAAPTPVTTTAGSVTPPPAPVPPPVAEPVPPTAGPTTSAPVPPPVAEPVPPTAGPTTSAPVPPPVAEPVPPTATPPTAAGSTPPAMRLDPPQEIVPQAIIPRVEPPPAPPVTAAEPPPIAATPPATPAVVVAPPPKPAAKPLPPPEDTSMDWLSNPLVWLAIALILLALGSMLLLPLLRRPARPKPVIGEESAIVSSPDPEQNVPDPETRLALRRVEAQSKRSISMLNREAPLVAQSSLNTPTARPAAAPPPKPIDELLKGIDFNLGDEKSRMTADDKDDSIPAAAQRLLEAEPPTLSTKKRPSFTPQIATQPLLEPITTPPSARAPTPLEPPSTAPTPAPLELDKLEFDLSELGLDTTRKAVELPPLELKSASSAAPPAADMEALDFSIPIEPPTQSDPTSGSPKPPKPADLKFEFTAVTQDQPDAHENLGRLDDDLLSFSGGDLGSGQMDAASPPAVGGASADYIETKLDLAGAYLDMGDHVGARSLLGDVLREGDENQKKRADALFKKLA